MNVIELENLTKTFGKVKAVDDLSLQVPEGSIYGFIGPNGSGKTTTLRMIMNIFYPDSGSIRIFGNPQLEASIDRVGYLPEERGLYKKMKVRELLRFYGELKRGHRVDKDIDYWLDKLELVDWGNTVNAEAIKDAVLELKSQGATVIFSTHDMHVAERMCDFIFMIFRGKKVLDGTLSSIQDEFGSDTLRIRSEANGSALQDVEGIEKVTDFGQEQELRIAPDQDHQKILTQIMSRTRVWSFELAKPTLYDIFVRIAGPEAKEDYDA